jgi:hypothetical protein
VYFYELQTKSTISENLREFVSKKPPVVKVVHGLQIIHIPQNIIRLDTTLTTIISRFGGGPAIFKMDPYMEYHWHTDAARSCTINMLIDDYDSRTMFSSSPRFSEIMEITELRYRPSTMYLLDVTKLHSVINFNNERYLLSLTFPQSCTFEQVRDFCIEEDI